VLFQSTAARTMVSVSVFLLVIVLLTAICFVDSWLSDCLNDPSPHSPFIHFVLSKSARYMSFLGSFRHLIHFFGVVCRSLLGEAGESCVSSSPPLTEPAIQPCPSFPLYLHFFSHEIFDLDWVFVLFLSSDRFRAHIPHLSFHNAVRMGRLTDPELCHYTLLILHSHFTLRALMGIRKV
jgi:hypothetical protein